jgi:hypothetical protein
MHSDCASHIGKTHRICQDYAVAGSTNDGAFVVLADGCSSSPDTDIGARLVAQSARGLLPEPTASAADWVAYHDAAIHKAVDCAEILGLPMTCLDATLLTVIASNSVVAACCHGDGVVVLGRQDGGLEVFAISYAASYPFYPSYRLDKARGRQWDVQVGNEKRVQSWRLGPEGVRTEDIRLSRSDLELFTGAAEDYRFAAVLSDGAQSFTETLETDTSRTPRSVSLLDVLTNLMAFKSSRGEFVQRRVTAFLKDCAVRRRPHQDDFALGVVWLGEG